MARAEGKEKETERGLTSNLGRRIDEVLLERLRLGDVLGLGLGGIVIGL